MFKLFYSWEPLAPMNKMSERGFSCLKKVKTYLRTTMMQERLSSLAILNLESDVINLINIEKVITEYSSKSDQTCSESHLT